jgi:hypothetical protein
MPDADLDIDIRRRGHREDTFTVRADPANTPGLQAILKAWLEGHGWHAGRWAEFDIEARPAGGNKLLARTRL